MDGLRGVLAIDQGTATLVAAVIAALASILALVPKYLEWQRARNQRRRLVKLLKSVDHPIRSVEWLSLRLGLSEEQVGPRSPTSTRTA